MKKPMWFIVGVMVLLPACASVISKQGLREADPGITFQILLQDPDRQNGVWNIASSISAVAVRGLQHCDVLSDVVDPDDTLHPLLIGPLPSSSMPSSTKNEIAASRSSTTMMTLSIRWIVMLGLLGVVRPRWPHPPLRRSRQGDPPQGPRPPFHDHPPRWDPHRRRPPPPRAMGGNVRGARPRRCSRRSGPTTRDPVRPSSSPRLGAWRDHDVPGPHAAGHAMDAARDLRGAARHAAYAAGQAAVVAHVAAHELGAAAYAIKAARAAAPEGEEARAGRLECRWQRDQLPEAIRELVLDDQRLRNDICWSVFDC